MTWRLHRQMEMSIHNNIMKYADRVFLFCCMRKLKEVAKIIILLQYAGFVNRTRNNMIKAICFNKGAARGIG